MPLARVTMVGLGVVTGISQDRIDADLLQGGVEEGHKTIDINTWSAAHQGSYDQVGATVDRHLELGVVVVNHDLPAFCAAVAATDVIGTAVTAIQPGGVEGGTLDPPAAFQETSDRRGQQTASHGLAEQAPAGLLERGEMRNRAESQDTAKIRVILQQVGDAAIVCLEEGLEDEAGKQLWLRIPLRTEFVRVQRQPLVADYQRLYRNAYGRLA